MNLHRNYKFATLGVAIFCTVVNASAMTLGRANGAVVLGQPLRLTVPIRMESAEGASALCFEADVFYGDVKQNAAGVGISSEYSAPSQSATVTITAQAVVEEPVVTVYLRAGCANKVTRRFVLLADVAPDAAQQAETPKKAESRSSGLKDDTPGVSSNAQARPLQVSKAPVALSTAQPANVRTTPSSPRATLTTVRRPQLKLVPFELAQEQDIALKMTDQLLVGPSEDLQARGLAAARWRSLNASAQDELALDSRSRALESDLKGLHDVTAKNRLILEDLTQRLEKAQAARYANPVVFTLFGAVLACGLVLMYAWRRVQADGVAAGPWWRDGGAADASKAGDTKDRGDHNLVDRVPPRQEPRQPASVPVVATERPIAYGDAVDIDLELDGAGNANQDVAARSIELPKVERVGSSKVAARSAGHVDFANSMTTSLRAVNTQEMLDVRQQAEFFMTLGQHEEAITMLRESVDSSFDANPLVYLDLLRILHTLGRKAEYDHYRTGFNSIFTGVVPEYGKFNQTGNGLEAYPNVCQGIVAGWPSEEAVSYIESCLVGSDGTDPDQQFDLEAFRDLLLLHAVARRIESSFDSGFMPFSATRPGTAASGARAEGNPHPDAEAVDLDLSESRGNLIDFEAADLLPQPHSIRRKPG